MIEEPVWTTISDGDLVRLAASLTSPSERQEVLRAIYDRHCNYVMSLCAWWLGDPDAAQDAAQATFETAINELAGADPAGSSRLRDPDKLQAWLGGIARNQCRAEWRRRGRQGELLEEDLEEAEHEITASRRRQAQVDRMLNVVAASLTERQQTVFEFAYRQGVRGQALGASIGLSEKEANDATYELRSLVFEGFGAYVLARDGRAYCPGLARILDQAPGGGQAFTRVLRLRILRHLDICETCDNCATCNARKKNLVRGYAPVFVPFLIAAELRLRIYNFIRRICTPDLPGGHDTRRADGSNAAPATGPILDAVVSKRSRPARRRRRKGGRRRLPAKWTALVAIAAAVVITGALIIPKVLAGSATGAASVTGPSLPAQLDSAQQSEVWQLASWTRPGTVSVPGGTQWKFIGTCATSACSYTLQIVKFTLGHKVGPDIWYWPIGGRPSTHVLHLHSVSGGYKGTDSFPTFCNGFASGPAETVDIDVSIKVNGTSESSGQLQANKLIITWTTDITHLSPEEQAAGCTAGPFTLTTQASLI